MSGPSSRPILVRIDARAAADGAGFFAAPATLLVEVAAAADPGGWHTRMVAAGPTSEVARHPACLSPNLVTIRRPRSVLIPGLVNAHTHLDLTHLGPLTHDPAAGFVNWVDRIRAGRRTDAAEIAESVEHGLRLASAAGTVAIGDIAGAPGGRPDLTPWRTMRRLGMRGVSFLEFFAMGTRADRGLVAVAEVLVNGLEEHPAAGFAPVLGLQPHAPNTVGLRGYWEAVTLATRHDRPICTHLAETPEEREFVAHARGPQRELLQRLGVWSDAILEDVGFGEHPVAHLADILAARPMLAVHVNDADDEAIATLARTGASVAYCPHASAYFGAPARFGPHRYRDMLAAGINVAVGTDSIVNLPLGSGGEAELSVLNEIRLLSRRDGTDPRQLLRMATINGAAALGLPVEPFTLTEGHPVAGVLAIDLGDLAASDQRSALAAVLGSAAPPEILFADNHSGVTGIVAGESELMPTLESKGERGPAAS